MRRAPTSRFSASEPSQRNKRTPRAGTTSAAHLRSSRVGCTPPPERSRQRLDHGVVRPRPRRAQVAPSAVTTLEGGAMASVSAHGLSYPESPALRGSIQRRSAPAQRRSPRRRLRRLRSSPRGAAPCSCTCGFDHCVPAMRAPFIDMPAFIAMALAFTVRRDEARAKLAEYEALYLAKVRFGAEPALGIHAAGCSTLIPSGAKRTARCFSRASRCSAPPQRPEAVAAPDAAPDRSLLARDGTGWVLEALLVAVDRVVGGVEIEGDPRRRPFVGLEEEIDEQIRDRRPIMADAAVAVRARRARARAG